MGENINKRSQGATEYLLILAAVLVIVAVVVYYVTKGPSFPTLSAVAEADNENIKITVISGEIAAGDWRYSISTTKGSYSWVDGTVKLVSPGVTIANDQAEDNYYVSLRHKPSGHDYFTDTHVEIVY